MGRRNKSKVFRRKLSKNEEDKTIMENKVIENEVITELERKNDNDEKKLRWKYWMEQWLYFPI